MNKTCMYLLISMAGCLCACTGNQPSACGRTADVETGKRVDSLLSLMTLEDKIGQLSQFSGKDDVTGPLVPGGFQSYLDSGYVGSLLNITNVDKMRRIQEFAVNKTQRKIPILFAHDVVHGYKTIFPIPLGETCSWDLALVRKNASVAAREAANYGIAWTFAPMLDVARDPRWGRVMESSGEDTYLGTQMGIARIKGFQGESPAELASRDKILACAKHFCAYGASEAGRDYNTVDLSERTLREVYLPPFEAAADAGIATFMTAFNDLSGVPCTANRFLLKEILRDEWGYKGFVVSDYTAVNELVDHRIAADHKEATLLAFNAGVDMDMTSSAYLKHMKELLNKGLVTEKDIDTSVRRVLEAKFLLGLFDDPYRYMNDRFTEKEKQDILDSVQDAACKSMVLLKNEGALPISRDHKKTVALIGPMVKSRIDMNGEWAANCNREESVSIYDGLSEVYKDSPVRFLYAKGCELDARDERMEREAIGQAAQADVILLALGESYHDCGEAASKTDIRLSASQRALLDRLSGLGKPIALVLLNGRPLDLSYESERVNAILEAWYPGTRGGAAIAGIISGAYNPSARLAMSFPRSVGQIPVYYNQKSTGRPLPEGAVNPDYCSFYRDCPNTPLYPFGYGLSYTTYGYKNIQIDKTQLKGAGDAVSVSIEVSNEGKMAGEEVVQMYIRDVAASVTRPVKELKGFQKIALQPGETKQVVFRLTPADLSFYDSHMKKIAEKGEFRVFIGSSSADEANAVSFSLEETVQVGN